MNDDRFGEVDWSPERKVVGGAVAVVALAVLQAVTGFDVPVGVEGAVAVLVAYLLPNKR